ncbi:hypothetical protein [Piscirickettsia litoralis]|uniref:Uncharacterized protein n=1 Tax=Piscirickettsia litoralis TaxID=1891921 RepID=A0ABX3A453_9GAMM|nr:hypothetical protein [Piscirickettsia litoralis]ODN43636.1 hypothetical protein BGC07_12860 [Piscirickettsia litoralis]
MIQYYQGLDIVELLPKLHRCCGEFLKGFPYWYAPFEDQKINPSDTMYVNDYRSLVIIHRCDNSGEINLVAAGLPLDSRYLLRDYFSADLIDQFTKAGYYPDNIWYMGYFLPNDKVQQKDLILDMYQQFKTHALSLNFQQLCYVDIVNPLKHDHTDCSPEPWGEVIPGFVDSSVRIKASWPTYQREGQICEVEHELAFYLKSWN